MPINSEKSLKTVALCWCHFVEEIFPSVASQQRPLTAQNRGQGFDSVFLLHPIAWLMHAKRFSSLSAVRGGCRVVVVCLCLAVSPPVSEIRKVLFPKDMCPSLSLPAHHLF